MPPFLLITSSSMSTPMTVLARQARGGLHQMAECDPARRAGAQCQVALRQARFQPAAGRCASGGSGRTAGARAPVFVPRLRVGPSTVSRPRACRWNPDRLRCAWARRPPGRMTVRSSPARAPTLRFARAAAGRRGWCAAVAFLAGSLPGLDVQTRSEGHEREADAGGHRHPRRQRPGDLRGDRGREADAGCRSRRGGDGTSCRMGVRRESVVAPVVCGRPDDRSVGIGRGVESSGRPSPGQIRGPVVHRQRLGVSGHSGFVVTGTSTSARRACAAPGVAGTVDLRLRSALYALCLLYGVEGAVAGRAFVQDLLLYGMEGVSVVCVICVISTQTGCRRSASAVVERVRSAAAGVAVTVRLVAAVCGCTPCACCTTWKAQPLDARFVRDVLLYRVEGPVCCCMRHAVRL